MVERTGRQRETKFEKLAEVGRKRKTKEESTNMLFSEETYTLKNLQTVSKRKKHDNGNMIEKEVKIEEIPNLSLKENDRNDSHKD